MTGLPPATKATSRYRPGSNIVEVNVASLTPVDEQSKVVPLSNTREPVYGLAKV